MFIRLMASEDYERVYALWQSTQGVGMRSLDDSRQGIEKFLLRNPTTNFVAQQSGEIVGVIMCGTDGRRAYIYHATVATGYRNKGIGKQLVDVVKGAAKKLGINKIALVVFADNAAGNAFWERMGFVLRDDLCYKDLSINNDNI